MTLHWTLKDCPFAYGTESYKKMRGHIVRDLSTFSREELEKLLKETIRWYSELDGDIGHTAGTILGNIRRYRIIDKKIPTLERAENEAIVRTLLELKGWSREKIDRALEEAIQGNGKVK